MERMSESELARIRDYFFAQGLVKLRLFDEEVGYAENVWSVPLGGGRYCIDNDPVSYDLHCGDVVEGWPMHDRRGNWAQWNGEPPLRRGEA